MGGELEPVLEVFRLAGDHKRGRGIEQRDVAERAMLAFEHVLHGLGIRPPHRRRAALPA